MSASGHHVSGINVGRAVLAVLALSVIPLALLTYFSISLSGDAVEREVEKKLRSTANLSATVVQTELTSLGELVQAYAGRPTMIESVVAGNRERIAFHLSDLRNARSGIYTTFVADWRGELIEIVPATPSIVGKDFSFRDWYRGAVATRGPYVSEVYRTQATGTPLVVAVASPILSGGRPVGILVAAYSLDYLVEFTARIARAQGVLLKVTDRRGSLVAQPGGVQELRSRRDDPRVQAALAGRSGITKLDTPEGRRLSSYAPVREVGWTVTASVPADAAFAAVGDLRTAVLTIAGVLALLLLAGVAYLIRLLRARRRLEDVARREADLNEAVLGATTDGIALVEGDGTLAVANEAFREMVGVITGKTFWVGDDLAETAAGVAERTTDPAAYRDGVEALANDTSYVGVHEYELADSGRAFQRYTAPVTDSGGGTMGRLIVLREVTAEREAERMKVELMSTVSHELRTPLTGILGFAELLVTQDLEEETRKRYLETIYGEARRLTVLINDFLDLQRLEAGRFRIALEPFDLRDVLRHARDLFSGQSADHAIELLLPDEPVIVAGEAERIAQVVSNLLSNAIKYSPGGGTVRVAVAATDSAVRVSVADEGLGIPAEHQRDIFTKFFRVDSSDTRSIGGTGLGLALCREMVQAHGGRMGFDSVEREGSTFWFELPAAASSTPHGRRRVLIVEDDRATAELLAAYLERAGFATEVTTTGEEALARAQAETPALVCLDIELTGELDGWDVLTRLRDDHATATVPVVICTGGNGRGKAASLGAADFLAKPFTAEQLRESVGRLLPEREGLILVADDERTVRRLVADALQANGFEVREAADGLEAMAAVERERPDAIVLDLLMPNLDGFGVLERLRKDPATRPIPVVVLTARRLSASDRSTLSRQTVSLLEKSLYSSDELVRLLKQAAGGATVPV